MNDLNIKVNRKKTLKRPVKKARSQKSKARWTFYDGTRLRAFREEKRLTRKGIAERLGVHVNAVYAWERGAYGPSAETLVSLANLAEGSQAAQEFLLKAGVEKLTLDRLTDRSLEGALHRGVLDLIGTTTKELSGALAVRKEEIGSAFSIRIAPLEATPEEASSEQILFPQSFISNPTSTRFYRIPDYYLGRFTEGDILLIDRLCADLGELESGALLAVAGGVGKKHSPMFGFLEKSSADHDTVYMLKTMEGASIYMGSSSAIKVEQQWTVLGRVIAWISQARGEK